MNHRYDGPNADNPKVFPAKFLTAMHFVASLILKTHWRDMPLSVDLGINVNDDLKDKKLKDIQSYSNMKMRDNKHGTFF